jgi:hypothetical protein
MFAVCAELLFPRPRALRIVCVEAAPRNFSLLQRNLQRYCPTAVALQCAVGVGVSVGVGIDFGAGRAGAAGAGASTVGAGASAVDAVGDVDFNITVNVSIDVGVGTGRCLGQAGVSVDSSVQTVNCVGEPGNGAGVESLIGQEADKREVELVFFTRIPGNSCLQTLAARNAQQRRQFMNPKVQSAEGGGGVGEGERLMCPVRTLGEVIAIATNASTFSAGTAGSDSASRSQVALLKVDVEGAELAALQGG